MCGVELSTREGDRPVAVVLRDDFAGCAMPGPAGMSAATTSPGNPLVTGVPADPVPGAAAQPARPGLA
jgi:hypothetical protein